MCFSYSITLPLHGKMKIALNNSIFPLARLSLVIFYFFKIPTKYKMYRSEYLRGHVAQSYSACTSPVNGIKLRKKRYVFNHLNIMDNWNFRDSVSHKY